ncbi:DNA polymerase III subunit gamma/tau [Paenirhodobacter populi]|uniref:DNA polymerase III subunit gamma/tau n=1 Tax=Paenirhodobacter populi TaxID=2306993 RepID=A0A443JNV4_9RHOB|nr:DNA polymerase III subunit gamma/tau [Sinirhodobacter populi]RWR22164.1 DNA polymerase III subunit gamma/tau [Sinirhodobacter populi]
MPDTAPTGYQVLARKYRPATFADLIGQEDMVRTLKNAFAADRIAHAFIMTGVRGVGKTTTARIIAKGLNCTGPDGKGGPTTEPCLQCENCRAIAEGRHVDVIEMDGASQTKVDDIRNNVLDSVHYAPTSARYKVYIIDEVHMLSNSAFNALLKTLEEPPAHVKFIFATTEIRKVPVTVLSRCQRFDLRRIEPEVMMAHLAKIAGLEHAQIAPDALALITRAAEGSVRDAMSLLDQAIAHGAGETTADQVRAMLGLADRARVLDLFDMVLKGDAAAALTELSTQYTDGADPMAVLRDLAEITHWVSVIKITPEAADDPTVPPEERTRGQAMAAAIPMRVLSRLWQMLLKAIEEVSAAPNAMMAAEMALIRMTHVADLPDPETLLRKLQSGNGSPAGRGGPAPNGGAAATTTRAILRGPSLTAGPASAGPSGAAVAVAAAPGAYAAFATFENVVELIRRMRDVKLLVDVENGLRLAAYSPGRIEFVPAPGAPRDLAQVLQARLQGWTGARWGVSIVNEGGAPTIAEVRDAGRIAAENEAREGNPVVQAILAAFPAAQFEDITLARDIVQEQQAEALPEVEDEWDPFEDG